MAEGLIPEGEVDPAEIARRAGMPEAEAESLRRELSTMFFVALWGRAHGIVPARADLARQRTCFPAAAGVQSPRLNGLLATRALAVAAIRAFSAAHGTSDPVTAARAVVLEWAQENGIECSGLQGKAQADWIIEASPSHFGYRWSFGIELIETLWLLGRVGEFRPQEVA